MRGEYGESCIEQLEERVRHGDIEARVYKEDLSGYLESRHVCLDNFLIFFRDWYI